MKLNYKPLGKKILVFTLICSLIAINMVPISYSWRFDESDGFREWWQAVYLYEDDFLIYFIGSIYLFLPLALIAKQKFIRWTLKSLTLISCFLVFIISMTYGTLSNDSAAGFGLIIALSIPLQVVALFLLKTTLFSSKIVSEKI